jgi:hypothetical protein
MIIMNDIVHCLLQVFRSLIEMFSSRTILFIVHAIHWIYLTIIPQGDSDPHAVSYALWAYYRSLFHRKIVEFLSKVTYHHLTR